MSWPAYQPPRPRDAGPAPLRPGTGAGGGIGVERLTGLGLGGHFDDSTWEREVARRGWERIEVAGVPGWISPPLAGLRILFACPRLDVTGLDSSKLYLGFRPDDTDVDELYVCRGGGEGELIFDKLLHAGGDFDRHAFVRWIEHESMASLRRLR